MTLRGEQSIWLAIALIGCSTETIVVATLDGSEEGASAGVAGESGPTGGGGVAEGGAGAAWTPRGGSAGAITQLEGLPTATICTCLGSESYVCGADGVTYDSACADGCNQIVILCLHACPCDTDTNTDTGVGGAPYVTEWLDASCFDPRQCPAGSLCFSADPMSTPKTCSP
jgi:hypothetical protein